LATGFGLEESDFEEFYDKPLGFMEEQQTLTGEALSESLRAATTSYDIGRRRTGMMAGQSLFDIKQQGDVAAARGGFAKSGDITAATQRAGRGVFQDYTMQQKELASTMAGAKTAFDIGTKEADLTYRSDVADFWKTTEDEYYDRMTYVEDL
jgi:hypothetical protein